MRFDYGLNVEQSKGGSYGATHPFNQVALQICPEKDATIVQLSPKAPSPSQTPYHQQLGRALIFVRSELVEPALVLDADHELIGCSKRFPQLPGKLRLRENGTLDISTEFVGVATQVLGMADNG